MKTLLLAVLCATLVACGGQARKDYYESVSVASTNVADVAKTKTAALMSMAQHGDAATSAAAVMALALMDTPTVVPNYVESEALSYTKALAAPVAGLGALWIQSDLSRDMNRNNNSVQRAQIIASSKKDIALYDALSTDTASPIVGQALDLVGEVVAGSNATTITLVEELQPIVPVEIVTPIVEIVPIEITPIANPNQVL